MRALEYRLDWRILGFHLSKAPVADQCVGEIGALGAPLVVRADSVPQQPERGAFPDIDTFPPAGERRQVVCRHARHRAPGIRRGRFEPSTLALQQQHAVAQNVRVVQYRAETIRDSAQILTDDHASGPHALQRQLADEIGERIGDIGPVSAGAAVRDPEQTRKAHRMVDPQDSGVAHVARDQTGERGETALREA